MRTFIVAVIRRLAALAILLAIVSAAKAGGMTPDLSRARPGVRATLDLRVVDQDALVVLKTIAEESGAQISVDPGLKLMLHNVSLQGHLESLLDQLSSSGNFVWWWDGLQYRVNDRRDLQTKFFDQSQEDTLRQIVDDLVIPAGTLMLRSSSDGGLIRVTAPRSLFDEIEPTLRSANKSVRSIRIIRYGRLTTERIN